MTLEDAVVRLVLGDGRWTPVLSRDDLAVFFPEDRPEELRAGIDELLRIGMLERIDEGVYVNAAAPMPRDRGIGGRVVNLLRPRDLNYLSLQSALAMHGIISQQTFRATYSTTGADGVFKTHCGVFELVRCAHSTEHVLRHVEFDADYGQHLLAHPFLALEDMQASAGCIPFDLDFDALEEACREWGPCHARSASDDGSDCRIGPGPRSVSLDHRQGTAAHGGSRSDASGRVFSHLDVQRRDFPAFMSECQAA